MTETTWELCPKCFHNTDAKGIASASWNLSKTLKKRADFSTWREKFWRGESALWNISNKSQNSSWASAVVMAGDTLDWGQGLHCGKSLALFKIWNSVCKSLNCPGCTETLDSPAPAFQSSGIMGHCEIAFEVSIFSIFCTLYHYSELCNTATDTICLFNQWETWVLKTFNGLFKITLYSLLCSFIQ